MSESKRIDARARRWLLIYAALPLAYVICGRLGLLLAVPPGYATAVFLPAGIAVAAMFMAGATALPPTFFGSLLLNVWIGYAIGDHIGLISIAAALVIGLASMLQTAVGGAVLRLTIGYPASLDNPRDVLSFLVLSPIFCLTSATLSLSGMWTLGAVRATDLLINWMTWWVGDTLGVLVALPLMLVIAGEPRSLWRSRARYVAIPMVLSFALFVTIFIRVNGSENDQSLLEFRLRSQHLTDSIKAMLEEQLGFLDQLSNVFVGRHEPVSRQDFHDLVQPLLQRFPTVQAVEWAPRVTSADRAAFEAVQQAELPGYLIRQRAASGELRRADNSTQFYPVTYLEPLIGNEPAVGFDLLSDPTRRDAIETTTDGGNGTATAPVRLVQEHGAQSGILLMHAVPGGPTSPGIVLVVLRMGTFANALANPLHPILNLRFADSTAGPAFFDNVLQSGPTSYETTFDFAGRRYKVTTTPTSEYLARHRGWQSWAVLAVGVLGTGLLGALLMLGTGHTYRIETLAAESKQLASIVEGSRDAIWSWAADGTIMSWNAEAERMFGYTAKELVGKSILTLIPSDRIKLAHDIISKVSRGQTYAPWETIRLRKDGTPVHVELAVFPLRDRQGGPTGAATICRDITERKRAEEARTRYLRMLDSSRDAIVVRDAQGRVTYWNLGAKDLYGWTREEALGQITHALLQTTFPKPFDEVIVDLMRDGRWAGEVTHRRKDGRVIDVFSRWTLERDDQGDGASILESNLDITERKQAEARAAADLRDMMRLNELSVQLVRSEVGINENLKSVLETAIGLTRADKGNVQLFTTQTLTIAAQVGFERPFLSFFEGVHDDASACSRAMRSGDRVEVEDVASSEIFAGQPAKDVLLEAGIRALVSTPLMDGNGKRLGMISVHFGIPHRLTERERGLMDLLARLSADYLERKQAEQISRTLVREVQHRANNLLAVVQTIASRSLSGDYSLAEAKIAFEARLQALARTTRQVTKSNWLGVNLKDIVVSELEPFSERALIEGDDVSLEPKQAQDISLALHELATNAAKHGALSNGSGMVKVSWATAQSDAATLKFAWRESGGPPVAMPTRSGFGTALLKATFPHSRVAYEPDGLSFELDVKLAGVQA
jgi:PAS domain S-box-containing protein